MKKILAILLLICMLLTTFASCKKDAEEDGETTNSGSSIPGAATEANPDGFDINESTIVYPSKGSDVIRDAAIKLSKKAISLAGKNIPVSDDFLSKNQKADEKKLEILVGETNRPESEKVKRTIGSDKYAFVIAREGNKIVILGTTAEMTVSGADYFINNYLNVSKMYEGMLDMEKGDTYTEKAQAKEFAKGKNTEYSIVTSVKHQSDADVSNTNLLKSKIIKNTGATPKIVVDTKSENAERSDAKKEILLGTTFYKQTQNYMSKLYYGDYGVCADGNKIVIFGYTEKTVKKAVELFDDILRRNTSNGVTTLPDKFSITKNEQSLKLDIPYYKGGHGQQIVEVQGKSNMVYVTKTNLDEFNKYKQSMLAEGFKLYTENTLGTSPFATYTKGNMTVNMGFDPTLGDTKIILDVGVGRPLRAEDNKYEKICEPKLIQVSLSNIAYNAGMAYMIRLSDGRIIVIDGGAYATGEAEGLYDLICKYCPLEKPVVAAWLMTHSHGDHSGAFLEMAVNHKMDLKIENIVYNMPTVQIGGAEESISERAWIENKIKDIFGAKIIYARAGQKFHYADVVVDVFHTPEEAYPIRLELENDNSVIYKITCKGQTFMVLGDCETREARLLERRYGSAMKADILQVAHHGYWASSLELNQFIDPEIVLWPCPLNWYHEAVRPDGKGSIVWEPNDFFFKSKNVKQIINSGYGTVVMDLPYKPQNVSYTPTYKDGDIIYKEDFENMDNMFYSGWYTVDSNKEKRQAMEVTLKTIGGDRGAYLVGHYNSVLCFVSPEKLYNAPVYTLELKLKVENINGGFSIRYNDNRPEYKEYGCEFDITRNGDQSIKMVVDRNAGRTQIYVNGDLVSNTTNHSNELGGLQFRSNNAVVFVSDIKVTCGK